MATGMIASGQETAAFEAEIGEALSMPPGVATSSGTAALAASLRALQVGRDHEVIVPTYVCRAVADAVESVGARPALCDVELDWCMSARTVADAITPRTRAVIVVHTFGICADTAGIRDLGFPIVEDCCQAIGAPGTGEIGAAVVLSFHATKLLTTGEGGMALARESGIAARLRSAVAVARTPLADVQAALGRSQLQKYAQFRRRRQILAERYLAAWSALPAALPFHLMGRSLFFRFPLRTSGDFDQLRESFGRRGVHVRRGVDALLHRASGLDVSRFPNAEQLFRETLSIPLYPSLTDDDQARVVEAARDVLAAPVVS